MRHIPFKYEGYSLLNLGRVTNNYVLIMVRVDSPTDLSIEFIWISQHKGPEFVAMNESQFLALFPNAMEIVKEAYEYAAKEAQDGSRDHE